MAPRTKRRYRSRAAIMRAAKAAARGKQKATEQQAKEILPEQLRKDIYPYDDKYSSLFETVLKRKENDLAALELKKRIKMESASALADFKINAIHSAYEKQVEIMQQRMEQKNKAKMTRAMTENARIQREHRNIPHKFDMNPYTPAPSSPVPVTNKKEQLDLVLPVMEEDMIHDMLCIMNQYKEYDHSLQCRRAIVIVPLSGGRMLYNNFIITPNTICTLFEGNNPSGECEYLTTTAKEKEGKHHRDIEIILKVSATRKRRYTIDRLRSGNVSLLFDPINIKHEYEKGNSDSATLSMESDQELNQA